MRYVKNALYIILTLVVFLSMGLFVGSIDSPRYDDLGLSGQIHEVPDSENGYSEVAYTQVEDFQLFDDVKSSEMVRQHIYGQSWDEKFVANRIAKGTKHMGSAISSLNYPYFKFPPTKDVGELPSYIPVMDMARMLIIKSMHYAKGGNFDEAIQYANYATMLSQKIKSESSSWLISHMIGLAMQYDALLWLNYLSVDYDLSSEQYGNILTILHQIPPYHQDSFSQVFAGEFIFARAMVDMISNRPFKQRWDEYWQNQDWWNTDLDNDLGFGERGAREEIFYLLQTLFPKYFMHKNRMLNASARHYAMLSQQAISYCSDLRFPEEESVGLNWLGLLKPNSLADQWVSNGSIFEDYYTRRCLGHAQIEAVKAIAAIMNYKSDYREMPKNLLALVPKYLPSLPIDPFNGGDIKYSVDSGYLYFVGANFNDDGGSTDSYFVRHCERIDTCANNPTFPILSISPVLE